MRSTVDRIRRAATLGSDVPRGEFPVRVHSVFRSALNLSLPDGDLLTVLSAETDDLPRGVRLASTEDFSSLGLTAGGGGVFSVGQIVLDRSAGRSPWRVDCASARQLAAPSTPPLRGDDALWRSGVTQLETSQERAATDLRIAPLLTLVRPSGAMGERLTQAALDLGRGVQTGRLDFMRAAVARLVGLGQGLTPAGDDFLCGFLAAGRCRRAAGLAVPCLLSSLTDAMRELLGQTTDISASFLRDAIAGRISRPLAALAEACSGAPGSDLDDALRRLAAIGHSSGLDAATGFFYGAAVWDQATDCAARAPAAGPPTISVAGRSTSATRGA